MNRGSVSQAGPSNSGIGGYSKPDPGGSPVPVYTQGYLDIPAGGNLVWDSGVIQNACVNVMAGSTATVQDSGTPSAKQQSGSYFSVAGTMTWLSGNVSTVTPAVTFQQSNVIVNSGGTWQIAAVNATWGGGSVKNTPIFLVDNYGTVSVANCGATVTLAGSYATIGTTIVDQASTLASPFAIVQSDGEFQLRANSTAQSPSFYLDGGLLDGIGTVTGTSYVGTRGSLVATISPGIPQPGNQWPNQNVTGSSLANAPSIHGTFG